VVKLGEKWSNWVPPPLGEGLGAWFGPPLPPTLGEGLRPGNRALFSKDLGTFGRLGTPPRGRGEAYPPTPLPPLGGWPGGGA